MDTLHQAARQHHASYAKHAPKPPTPAHVPPRPLVPGDLVLVLRPRRSKLLTPNSGPYIVISVQKHTATIRNLATAVQFNEHLSNVRMLNTTIPK